MMQQLQPKLRINLKNLPSNSGGSSSYSNKDLSERPQGIMRQQKAGPLTSGVSPTIQRNFTRHWPKEGLEMDNSNRTGTELDDPMLMSGGTQMQAAFNLSNSNIGPMPANLSQDPYFYLQWRQQTHKSCRSAHPNHQASYRLAQRQAASLGTYAHTLRVNQGLKRHRQQALGNGQVNDSASSHSNSSQTTVPVKTLTEVKNPSNLITFRFVNRRVTHLTEISRFRNLTELDVNGNLLKSEVPELCNLPFLKKLNLASNQITDMWPLPKTLEILNISFNCLKKLDVNVMRTLSNLSTLEMSNNGMESLEGLECVSRLKHLVARNNQIQSLTALQRIQLLVEIDLENNPIDSAIEVLQAVSNKKDILILNLKLAPLMVKIQSYAEFFSSGSLPLTEDTTAQLVQEFKQLLSFLHNGTFYRRKKTYLKMRQQQLQTFAVNDHRFSNFSNDEDSSNGATHHQNTESTSSIQDDLLSDEFLERQFYLDEAGEEDLPRGVDLDELQTYHNQHFGVELNASTADFNKEIKQINQQLLSEGHLAELDLADSLNPICAKADALCEKTSQVQAEAEGQEGCPRTLNKQESASCSDQIDTQEISVVVPREERSSRYTNRQHHMPSSTSKELESSVVRSSHILDETKARLAQNDEAESFAAKSVASKKKALPSFKLDLDKLKNPHAPQKQLDISSGYLEAAPSQEFKSIAHAKLNPGESMRTETKQVSLMSVRMLQSQVGHAQISERIPIKKMSHYKSPKAGAPGDACYQSVNAWETSYQTRNTPSCQQIIIDEIQRLNQASTAGCDLTAMPVTVCESAQTRKTTTVSQQQKQVHIPKLALQNIHRQPCEQPPQTASLKLIRSSITVDDHVDNTAKIQTSHKGREIDFTRYVHSDASLRNSHRGKKRTILS